MNPDYLDAAQEGKNEWWRYLVAFLLILFFWLILGNIPIAAAAVVVMADDDPTTDVSAFGLVGIDPLWNFALLMFSFVAFLLGIVIAVRFILVFLSGFLFMLPHLANPEVSAGPVLLALFYFSFGAFLALVTLKDNGLELALGAHAGNNLFTGVLVNYEGSALPTPAIFTVSELDAMFNLVASLVAMAIFYVLIFKWIHRFYRFNGFSRIKNG